MVDSTVPFRPAFSRTCAPDFRDWPPPFPLQVGGGYRSLDAIEAAVEAGAARVMVGTAAASPEFLEQAAARFRRAPGRGHRRPRRKKSLYVGWTELSELNATDLARACADAGVARLLVTSTRRDGSLAGPDFELLDSLLEATRLPVIAAGGVATLDDLTRAPYGRLRKARLRERQSGRGDSRSPRRSPRSTIRPPKTPRSPGDTAASWPGRKPRRA